MTTSLNNQNLADLPNISLINFDEYVENWPINKDKVNDFMFYHSTNDSEKNEPSVSNIGNNFEQYEQDFENNNWLKPYQNDQKDEERSQLLLSESSSNMKRYEPLILCLH